MTDTNLSSPSEDVGKPYDQFILFGDSITQMASNQENGFGFQPALQEGWDLPSFIRSFYLQPHSIQSQARYNQSRALVSQPNYFLQMIIVAN